MIFKFFTRDFPRNFFVPKIFYKRFSCKFEGVEFFRELFFSLSKGNFREVKSESESEVK